MLTVVKFSLRSDDSRWVKNDMELVLELKQQEKI